MRDEKIPCHLISLSSRSLVRVLAVAVVIDLRQVVYGLLRTQQLPITRHEADCSHLILVYDAVQFQAGLGKSRCFREKMAGEIPD